MRKPGIVILLVLKFFSLFSCENPMVNYLLGEKDGGQGEKEEEEEEEEEQIDNSEVALWNGTWYYSLAEAVDAADDGTSEASPSLIEIRRNVTRSASMGGGGITLPAGKHIRLEPYTPDAASVTIGRWEAGGAFFTVESGASLALGAGMTIDGALIVSSGPLVMAESGSVFTMDDGSLVTRGRSSNPGSGVHVKTGGTFAMKGSARVAGTGVYVETGGIFTMKENASAGDVYLEAGEKITVDGILTANPAARITPPAYPDAATLLPPVQVLDGDIDSADGNGVKNNEKFDVAPEDITAAGWDSPRHWRIDDNGFLYSVVARRRDPLQDIDKYYVTLQDAFDKAYGTVNDFETVTLIANIDLDGNDTITVNAGHFIRLTVPAANTYTIKRVQNAVESMFVVSIGGGLELEAPAGTELILDGGALWNGGTPAQSAVNTGVKSTHPLVSVSGMVNFTTKFILRSGAVLQNNDRTMPGVHNGGAVAVTGLFQMYGGRITSNRTSGSGGGIYFNKDNGDALLAGGSITGNDAELSGGGIMLYLFGGKSKLTMTGGLISGNRAGGKAMYVSPSLGGYGGGVFIPGSGSSNSTRNEFHMAGGTIRDNISASGKGNGIAADLNNTPVVAPVFTIKGNASIINDDVLLHVDTVIWPGSPSAARITVDGPFSPSTPVRITLDNYASLPMQVLAGSYGPYISKFTAAPYHINSSGRIY
ncbi:MAG: hypothetical protein LBS06_07520 [Treponema sp.]|jgi:hypothetical protein|nr:hypothetical protein [Treponema sp.]